MNNIQDLTKQLISIPSWVGDGCDEIKVGEFIYQWLKENTSLKLIKQPVKDGRFNVIAVDDSPTTLLLAGHIDTVEPRAGWNTDPFTPLKKNGRLYGLGSTDMKGSLAASMIALRDADNTEGVMLLCYCDEEYDFAGMKAFIKEYQGNISPELVVSLDGYAGKIGNGCRGLIEVSFRMRGKSGHAGRPEQGVNAILAGTNCITKLKRLLANKYSSSELGLTTLNLAYSRGGLDLGSNKLGKEGNNIPDLAEFVLDIRPATAELNATVLKELLTKYADQAKLTLENYEVRHDLGSWSTPTQEIQSKLSLPGDYETFGGYVDTQMIWGTFGKPTCLAIGAGTPSMAHSANEYVELADLIATSKSVSSLLTQTCIDNKRTL